MKAPRWNLAKLPIAIAAIDAVNGNAIVQGIYFDSIPRQHVDKSDRPFRSLPSDEVILDVAILTQVNGGLAGLMESSQQINLVLRREFQRRQGTDVMIANAVAIGQFGFVVATRCQAACASLFPQDTESSLKGWPFAAIAGIERVEDLRVT